MAVPAYQLQCDLLMLRMVYLHKDQQKYLNCKKDPNNKPECQENWMQSTHEEMNQAYAWGQGLECFKQLQQKRWWRLTPNEKTVKAVIHIVEANKNNPSKV